MPTELADGLGLRGAPLENEKTEERTDGLYLLSIAVKIRPEDWFLRSGFTWYGYSDRLG